MAYVAYTMRIPAGHPVTTLLTCENAEQWRQYDWTYLDSANFAAAAIFGATNAIQSAGAADSPRSGSSGGSHGETYIRKSWEVLDLNQ
jgi:hypothetical protein